MYRKYGISFILGLVPGIAEQLLAVNLETIDEETVFFQLQSVFAHLMESRLQYFVPDRWESLRLDPEILHTVRILILNLCAMISDNRDIFVASTVELQQNGAGGNFFPRFHLCYLCFQAGLTVAHFQRFGFKREASAKCDSKN
jgi:hypothetical protein